MNTKRDILAMLGGIPDDAPLGYLDIMNRGRLPEWTLFTNITVGALRKALNEDTE